METVEALKQEIDNLKKIVLELSAEKEAIDQVALKEIQENIQLRKQLVLFKGNVDKLNAIIEQKNTEITDLKNKLASS